MYDVIVIGGGPIGLNAAIKLAKKQKRILLVEAEDYLGGQLVRLYPEKEIVDIKNILSIKAKDYITSLINEMKNYPQIEIKLNTKIETITSSDSISVSTNKEQFSTKYLIIATGLGTTTPRKIGIEYEDECNNILYALKDLDSLKNRRVLVLGGGDSALDWAKEISQISEYVTIIHRRKEFRGNFQTIAKIKNIIVKTPYIPYKIEYKDSKLQSLFIKNVENNEIEKLPADYVLVNYGNIPSVNCFNLNSLNNGLVVNEKFQTSLKNVFAIGDIARYENKKNRIQPGLDELEQIINYIK